MTPDIVFIIPYRDREEQKTQFIQQMNILLENVNKNGLVILRSRYEIGYAKLKLADNLIFTR